ncbi:hypothetical protein [Flexithrix dorotheae]|uniref:hypothetical protein n=1 Tax=Flexithrix dorotheae TaxID=70993 RepID=UPI000377CF67|nr:hypothetical protein [Flexithrix dorotheae]
MPLKKLSDLSTKQKKQLYIFGVLVGGYLIVHLLFLLWKNTFYQNPWQLIPDQTLVVIESENFPRLITKLNQDKNYENKFVAGNAKNQVRVLDSLFQEYPILKEEAESESFLVSFHQIHKKKIDYVFYLPFPAEDSIFNQFLSPHFNSKKKFERNYKANRISEYRNKNGEIALATTRFKNYFILSSSSLLIDEIIREEDGGKGGKIFSKFKRKAFETDEKADFACYFHIDGITQLLSSLQQDKLTSILQPLFHFQDIVGLNFQITPEKIKTSGILSAQFSKEKNLFQFTSNNLKQDFLPLFDKHNPTMVFNFGIDDFEQFHSKLKDREITVQSELKNGKGEILDKEKFLEFFSTEMTFVLFPNFQDVTGNSALFLKLADQKQTEKTAFIRANKALRLIQDWSIFQKKEIYKLNIPDFPKHLFGSFFTGFSYSFCTFYQDYLVISSDQNFLQRLIQVENSQGENVPEVLREEVNSTFGIDLKMLSKKNSTGFMSNAINFPDFLSEIRFPVMALSGQVVAKREWLEVNGSFQFDNDEENTSTGKLLATDTVLRFNKKIISRIIDFPTGKENSWFIFQDNRFNINFIREGKKQWEIPLWRPFSNEIYQLNKNRYDLGTGAHFAFASGSKVNLVDTAGKYISPFPVFLPSYFLIDKFALIPLPPPNKYGFLLSDQYGNVFILNQNGEKLSKWEPRKLRNPLGAVPVSIKMGNKQGLVFLLKNGELNILDLNGKAFPGFPLQFNSFIENPPVITMGENSSESFIRLLTNTGEIILVSLEGKIISRNQIRRYSSGTSTKICVDKHLRKDWIITQKEGKSLNLLNNEGQFLSRIPLENNLPKIVNYYSFGFNTFISVFDQKSASTNIYSLEGRKLNTQPFISENEFIIQNTEAENIFFFYRYLNGKLEKVIFSL